MLRHPHRPLIAFAALLLVAATASAQTKKLQEGDTAPGLDIEEWVKGDETTFQSDHVYLIDFWATWCGPCIRSIPHLTELQHNHRFRNFSVIGISKEEPDIVKRFVRKQGDAMGYRVAVDRRGTTSRNWMEAAGRNTIPSVFLVDGRGRVQYIGNPLTDPEETQRFMEIFELVLDGRYDARLYRQTEPLRRAIDTSRQVKNWRMANKHLDELIEVEPHIFALWQIQRFDMILMDQDDKAAAYDLARKLMTDKADDPTLLARLARKIIEDPKIPAEKRDYDVALELAKAAAAVTDPNDPRRYYIQALVHYHRGEYPQAVALQRQAWRVAIPSQKDTYKHDLEVFTEAMREGRPAAKIG